MVRLFDELTAHAPLVLPPRRLVGACRPAADDHPRRVVGEHLGRPFDGVEVSPAAPGRGDDAARVHLGGDAVGDAQVHVERALHEEREGAFQDGELRAAVLVGWDAEVDGVQARIVQQGPVVHVGLGVAASGEVGRAGDVGVGDGDHTGLVEFEQVERVPGAEVPCSDDAHRDGHGFLLTRGARGRAPGWGSWCHRVDWAGGAGLLLVGRPGGGGSRGAGSGCVHRHHSPPWRVAGRTAEPTGPPRGTDRLAPTAAPSRHWSRLGRPCACVVDGGASQPSVTWAGQDPAAW